MPAAENLALLQRAYAEWDRSRGANTKVWFELAHDDFRIRSMPGEAEPLRFAEPSGAPALAEYLEALIEDWEMVFLRPETYVADDEHVAMFGTTSWTYRATGNTVTTPIAHLWRFRSGKVVSMRELFDSAAVLGAALSEE